MSTVTLSPSFELQIPQEIREAMHLTPGEEFRVISYAGRLEFIPISSMKSMRGFLPAMDTTIERDEDRL